MAWKYGLDFLRASAIILVLLFHYELPETYFFASFYKYIHESFHRGVDLFFVLSGFLISSHWFKDLKQEKGAGEMWKSFYIKRVFRIFPLYYTVLIFEMLRATYLTKTSYNFLSYFTLTQNIFGQSIFPVSWSLCVEEHFYLIFPALSFLVIRKLKANYFPFVSLILFFLSPLLRFALFDKLDIGNSTFLQNTIFQTDGISLGVLLGYLSVYIPSVWKQFEKKIRFVEGLGLLILLVSIYWGGQGDSVSSVTFLPMLFSLGFACFLISANFENSVLNTGKNKFITLTAKLAYPLYLLHYVAWMILSLLMTKLDINIVGPLKFILFMVGAYVVSYLAHIIIEKRFLELRKRFLN